MTTHQPPLATYRLQFNPGFRFEDARPLVPYLSSLGITHVYSSPLLRPRRGSTHGYDVVDPTTINPELGDEVEFREFVRVLKAHGMGLILDIVPNHMAASSENPYWLDVLTYGHSSPYARWFDIDWRLPDRDLWGRVLVPVLGEPLTRVLAQNQLRLVWKDGRFFICYFDHVFPVDPATVPSICLFGFEDLRNQLGRDHPSLPELRQVLKGLRALPKRTARRRRGGAVVHRDETAPLLSRLAQLIENSPLIRQWAGQTAENFTGVDGGAERMRKLLSQQSYQLVHWRVAARIVNYRRFFDINDLISVRQEHPEVFNETHALVGRWIREELLDGLRIDHIDGLRDPLGYLVRLQELAAARERNLGPFRVFVEKILGHDEPLPEDWPVSGTTGYDSLNRIEALFISQTGAAEIEQNYRRLLRKPIEFRDVAAWGKRRVLRAELSAFVGRLAATLARLSNDDPQTAALGQRDLVDAIVEVAVGLPVYRTYINSRDCTIRPTERESIETALSAARQCGRASPEALNFVERVLLLETQPDVPENQRQDRLNFIQRFQQLTGPAAAKGVEDTALYAYVPLVSRNEVGGEPDAPLGDAACRLHEANRRRAESRPFDMLAATTHDTKRSADVRSRLDVLSELPKLWTGCVDRWRRWNRPNCRQIAGKLAPDANTEYLFYQTLVGVWPAANPSRADEDVPDAGALNELRDRVEQYMLKAGREAKLRTSWVDPDPQFEEALVIFIRSVFLPGEVQSSRFLKDVHQFVARIARPGFWNSLSRTLVQFTAPGSPDLYQGDELWNFALVDPDNRRPVDYDSRRRLLDEIVTGFEGPAEERAAFLRTLVEQPEDGRIKLHVIRSALHARRSFPGLFAAGQYEPLDATGSRAAHVFGYLRTEGRQATLVVVPRLVATLLADPARPPTLLKIWGDTAVRLSGAFQQHVWKSALTGETVGPASQDGRLSVADLFCQLPLALLFSS